MAPTSGTDRSLASDSRGLGAPRTRADRKELLRILTDGSKCAAREKEDVNVRNQMEAGTDSGESRPPCGSLDQALLTRPPGTVTRIAAKTQQQADAGTLNAEGYGRPSHRGLTAAGPAT